MKQFMKKNISDGIKALKAGETVLRVFLSPALIISFVVRELHAFLYDAVVLDYLSGQDDGCQ